MITLGQDALAEVDLVLTQGATNRFSFRWLAGDPAVPVSLAGWTGKAQFRRSVASDLAWLTLTSPATIALGSDGKIVLTVDHPATEGDEWDERDSGVWDLELTSPSGDRTRFAGGVFRVSHEVTRV